MSDTPKACLDNLYKKRVSALAELHVQAYRVGSQYCSKHCLYTWGFDIEAIRPGNDTVEYLVENGQYSGGVASDEFDIDIFKDGQFKLKKTLCWKRSDEDGVNPAGDQGCNSKKAKALFGNGNK